MIKTSTQKLLSKSIVVTFLIIPFLSSIISTFHLIDFFKLGNWTWMSVILGVAFEVGSVASLLIITILDKIKLWMIYTIFIILVSMQIIGNVYFSFDFINKQLLINSQWLKSATELFSYILGNDIQTIKIFLSFLIGTPIPLISLMFLKSTVDYLKFKNEIIQPAQINQSIENSKINNPIEIQPKVNIIKNEIDNVKNTNISERGTIKPTKEGIYGTGAGYNTSNNSNNSETNQEAIKVETENKNPIIKTDTKLNAPIIFDSEDPEAIAILQNNTPK